MNKVDINKIEVLKFMIFRLSVIRRTFLRALGKIAIIKFLSDSVSFSKQNVLRGLSKKKTQAHLVTIIRDIFDVTVDLEDAPKLFGKFALLNYRMTELDKYFFLVDVPGFQVTSKEAIIHYKLTDYYSGDEGGIDGMILI